MREPTMFDRTPEQEREAIKAANVHVVHWLLVATVALLAYQTFRTPKQLSTLQVCAHKKEAINANTFETDLQKKWIEEVSCQPVRYFDDINNPGTEVH